jgi:hypothetical protein
MVVLDRWSIADPKEYLLHLTSTAALLEANDDGILIRPAVHVARRASSQSFGHA